ncbi:MAG: hypothetical protein ABI553_03345 [Chloroflexota bacterium]
MRSAHLVTLSLLLAGCGASGWHGTDVHLVDGTWIGTETACGQGDDALECRTIVERTMAALPSDVRANVTKAVLADLPTTLVNFLGETHTAHLAVGIETRKAVVIDLVDGTRRVIGLWCMLPSSSDGTFLAAEATCRISPLDYWRDGNDPPP